MNEINLSYVITTHNKLPYLKEVMKQLLENVKEDEEIVVVDGASKDGTVEYLTELYQQGKIHQFISEPDKGEAHGYNKAMLMAKGELIKLITDDDVFYYPGIQECKRFMLEHKNIDFLFSNVGLSTTQMLTDNSINDTNYFEQYKSWKINRKSFIFNGLGIMLRKSSIPLFGLLATDFILVDNEISLRACKISNMALYTGYIAVNIHNTNSKPRPAEKVGEEFRRLERFYNWELPAWERKIAYPPKITISQFVNLLKRNSFARGVKKIFNFKFKKDNRTLKSDMKTLMLDECITRAENWLFEKNSDQNSSINFVYKEQ